MNILISNDDGIHAKGLQVLAKHLAQRHAVSIVAPDRERSAIGHAITLDLPIRVQAVPINGFSKAYAVSGTPADCIKLALMELLDEKPDLMISGINPGANVGVNVFYSGTFAAAREATLYGIPAMAVSIQGGAPDHYETAAATAAELAEYIGRKGLPPGTLLNVNMPDAPRGRLRGYRWSRQAISPFRESIEKRMDPWNRPYYWQGAVLESPIDDPTLDIVAMGDNYVSLTPIKCDMTDYESLQRMKAWDLIFA